MIKSIRGIMISTGLGLMASIALTRYTKVDFYTMTFLIGIIFVSAAVLNMLSSTTDVPLTSFTMRGSRSREFEDWMGVNSDLENGRPKAKLQFEMGAIVAFLFHRSIVQLLAIGTILMVIGIYGFKDYFI